MANAFAKGDIVRLKSGGPPMTVDNAPGEAVSIYTDAFHDEYVCAWFRGASKETGRFGEHLLEAYVAPGSEA